MRKNKRRWPLTPECRGYVHGVDDGVMVDRSYDEYREDTEDNRRGKVVVHKCTEYKETIDALMDNIHDQEQATMLLSLRLSNLYEIVAQRTKVALYVTGMQVVIGLCGALVWWLS